MSSPSPLFREESLRRISSPDELDRRLSITSSRAWLALAGVGIILATALLWGIFGRVHVTVNGKGILLRSGGVFEVIATGTGQITDVTVRPDDHVEAGQVIARVSQPELTNRINNARERLDEISGELAEVQAAYGERDGLKLSLKELEERRLEESLKRAKEIVAFLDEKVAGEEELYDSNLIRNEALIQTYIRLHEARTKIQNEATRLEELELEHKIYENERDEALRDLRGQLNQQRRELLELERQRRLAENITSPYTGSVVDILKGEGKMVQEGEGVVRLELSGREILDLEVVFYVDPAKGKKITGGMETRVSPSTVAKEEYGTILGTVVEVSDHPATSEGMLNTLANESLIESLSQGGAPIQARANLTPSADTFSGYRWTSGSGPEVKLRTGTLCEVSVAVEKKRPISLVIPALKRWLGLF